MLCCGRSAGLASVGARARYYDKERQVISSRAHEVAVADLGLVHLRRHDL